MGSVAPASKPKVERKASFYCQIPFLIPTIPRLWFAYIMRRSISYNVGLKTPQRPKFLFYLSNRELIKTFYLSP